MNQYQPQGLLNAVAAICPEIKSRVLRASKPIDEQHLWWELSVCILSSQVPYDLSVAAADVINAKGLLTNDHYEFKILIEQLIRVLSTPLLVEGRLRKYRFPVARAHYLAAARSVITAERCSLQERLDKFQDATEARSWFVKHIPGIGPKQASMFLRNTGVSYDLAILDRHVLNYMSKLGIYSGTNLFISGLAKYRQHEHVLREHAKKLDCQVGLLDWAIWIVMRVANRNMEVVAI